MVISKVTDEPNHILQLFVEGAQEILGLDQFQQIDNLSWKSGENGAQEDDSRIARLPIALEKHYGVSGGHGLALRIGRSAFKYLLQRQGASMGLTTAEFRLQRAPQRMETGLRLLTQQIINESHDQISISDAGTHWVWRSENCPVCRGRNTGVASCYLMVGVIQEFLAWSGGGRFYGVTETECSAAGASACTYWIEKKPLD